VIRSAVLLFFFFLSGCTGNRAGWIVDSQRIKPGNHMPPNPLEPRDLQALLAYLERLK
jgi:cytochrome c oxidase subunit 2